MLNTFVNAGVRQLKGHWSSRKVGGTYHSTHTALLTAVFGLAPLFNAVRAIPRAATVTTEDGETAEARPSFGVVYVPGDATHTAVGGELAVNLGADFARVTQCKSGDVISDALMFL